MYLTLQDISFLQIEKFFCKDFLTFSTLFTMALFFAVAYVSARNVLSCPYYTVFSVKNTC